MLGSDPLGGHRGGGGQGQNSFFSEYSYIAYQITGNEAYSNMIANILPADTPLSLGVSQKGQKTFFSESSHVAYQIKGNGVNGNMQANILSLHTSLTPGLGSKGQNCLYLKGVMLHIKLKGRKYVSGLSFVSIKICSVL